MGISTNGLISFGIAFDEDAKFPWDEYDGDIDEWWIKVVNKFKHTKEIYTKDGERQLRGITEADVDAYYEEKRKFEAEHPCLVELENYCSDECPMYMLTVKESNLTARRGYPVEFNPLSLTKEDEYKKILVDFCKEHGIEMPSEPKWYLYSYYG